MKLLIGMIVLSLVTSIASAKGGPSCSSSNGRAKGKIENPKAAPARTWASTLNNPKSEEIEATGTSGGSDIRRKPKKKLL